MMNAVSGQLATLAAVCVKSAFDKRDTVAWRRIPADKQEGLGHALDCLCRIAQGPERREDSKTIGKLVRGLWSISPDEDSPEVLVKGWPFILDATIGGLRCARGEDPAHTTLDALYGAYHSLCYKEIVIPEGGCNEDEFRELEAASAPCMAELEFQLRCLGLVKAGATWESLTNIADARGGQQGGTPP